MALGDLVLQRFDARLEELDDAAALVADQVVVVVAGAQPLVAVAGLADPQRGPRCPTSTISSSVR